VTTALVPVCAVEPERPQIALGIRPQAAFLAQLIAAAVQAPQARTRRRADPGEAIAAYAARQRSPRGMGTLARSL
jgi:hypothetical protein